ncbi:tryptophan synthase beta subunit-like PLP-dependent enzyme [Trichodelitschia bisporula]|uniref:Tryptophan synthase beta subunit-like PLP-dependent enzyme n=1 Tax=Trichodelitschia bisporula TaxID=703511 RepID=A0A6G1I2J6_9PEZI|nr:tryptophan synthase beta subunit-like PLP-dependent enzyme [Trichodelitschia bisporula]
MHLNPSASSWTCVSQYDPQVLRFHQSQIAYKPTPLTSLPRLAEELRVGHLLVKDESYRLGLPSFKILGASWAVWRAVCAKLELPYESTTMAAAGRAARASNLRIVTCTEGNWGEAVSKMSWELTIPVKVFVPSFMNEETQAKMFDLGAEVLVLSGDYDTCIAFAKADSEKTGSILMLDTSWPRYTEIPQWVTDGYSTMLAEVDQQVESLVSKPVTHSIASVGVGSWAQAVVAHYKGHSARASVITVEPEAAGSLYASLAADEVVPIKTGETIMCGMNCGTTSAIAWPFLRNGVDASVLISDREAHKAVEYLNIAGVDSGPCGAAPFAALRKFHRLDRSALNLGKDSVVVLFSTEGPRRYPVPSS